MKDQQRTTTSRKYLKLDLTDSTNRALAGYAGRVGTFLAKCSGAAELAGCLDDFLGAVYSLIQARENGFVDRTGPIDIGPVEKRAQRISVGEVRIDGKWIAGFYFNNALFRIAAVQHRILKIVAQTEGNPKTKKEEYVGQLLKSVRPRFPEWTQSNLDLVHKEINGLKHDPKGVHDRREVTFEVAVSAVGELLALLDASNAAKDSD